MKWLLVGHRGVGKTNLLQRLKIYFANQLKFPNCVFLDLDHEISIYSKKSIDSIFSELGEEKFRQLEQEIFLKIHTLHQNYILSVGAGFSLDSMAVADFNSLRIIWLRRSTDILGRIFFNRPRLNKNLSPLAEFKERYPFRQMAYAALANDVYFMPEGIESAHPAEERIFTATNLNAEGILTLTPGHFKNNNHYFLRYGCTYFEFRDDLLNLDNTLWEVIPMQQRLLSFRNKLAFETSIKYINEFALTDWALELGPCPDSRITILSCHNFIENENLTNFLQRLESSALAGQHLKVKHATQAVYVIQQL